MVKFMDWTSQGVRFVQEPVKPMDGSLFLSELNS